MRSERPTATCAEPSSKDYRTSHMEKGADYDECLGTTPFERYISIREAQILTHLVNELYPDGLERYLDFACGTGRITSLLAPRAKFSYGVDVSASMVEEARKKSPGTRFVLQDVTREPLSVEPFDLITAFRFFGNAQDELRVGALRAIAGMLKPGGYLIINNHRNLWCIRNIILRLAGRDPDGDISYGKLKRLLVGEGFELTRAWGIGAWIVRAALMRPAVLESRVARGMESLSRFHPVALVSPDALLVLRKPTMAGAVGRTGRCN